MSIYMLKKYNFIFNDEMMMFGVRSLVFVELAKTKYFKSIGISYSIFYLYLF